MITPVQPTTASKPLYTLDGTKHSLTFDGLDDYLEFETAPLSNSVNHTLIIAFRLQKVGGTQVLFSQRNTADANPSVAQVSIVEGILNVVWSDNAATTVSLNDDTNIIWIPTVVVVRQSGNTRTLRVGGVNKATNTTVLSTTTTNAAQVGRNAFTEGQYFEGNIDHIVIDPTTAFTDQQVLDIEGWLSTRLSNVAPAVTISVDDINVAEGVGNAQFTVELNRSTTQTVTVNYQTADGTATVAGSDYTNTTGTLTFNPGEVAKVVNVPVNDDALDEPAQTFSLTLNTPTNATIADGTGICTIAYSDSFYDFVATLGGIVVDFNPTYCFSDAGKTTACVADDVIVGLNLAVGSLSLTTYQTPTLRVDGNSKYYCEFSGASSASQGDSFRGSSAPITNSQAPITLFAAAKNNNQAWGIIVGINDVGSADNSRVYGMQYASALLQGVGANVSWTSNSLAVIGGRRTSMSVNGTMTFVNNTTAQGTSNTPLYTVDGFGIGQIYKSNYDAGFNGNIYAVVVVPSSTSPENTDIIRQWLADRAGIVGINNLGL